MFYTGDYIAKTINLDPSLDESTTGSYSFTLTYDISALDDLKNYALIYPFNPPTGSHEELVSVISGSKEDGIEIFFDNYSNISNLNSTNNVSKLPSVYSSQNSVEDLSFNNLLTLNGLKTEDVIETNENSSTNISECANNSDIVVGLNNSLPVSSLDTFESKLTILNIEVTKTNTIKEIVYIEPPSTPQPPREYVYKVKAIITDLFTNSQYPAIVYYKDINKIPTNIRIIGFPARVVKTSTMQIVDIQ